MNTALARAGPRRARLPLTLAALWLIVCATLVSSPAAAQTGIRRTRPSGGNPLAAFTLGSGLEYESDDEKTQTDYPLVLEYSPTEKLTLTFESAITRISSNLADVPSANGLDDLESSVEYEFRRERRYSPALTVIGLVKSPIGTAGIGTPGTDYAVGLIASKGFVHFDLDLNVLYTAVGDPEGNDNLEISLSATYPLTYKRELLAEILHASDTGETETTIGLALHPSPFLTFEQGLLYRTDGSWQCLFAVVYSFGGTD